MKYKLINKNLFIKNRQAFIAKLKKNSTTIFNSNDVMPSNSDGTMPFIQNSDLFWLSGIDQEESILIIHYNKSKNLFEELLFLKETNEHIAIWEGEKLTKKIAFNVSGISSIYWLSDFENIVDGLISKSKNIYLNKNMHSRANTPVQSRDDRFRILIKNKFPNKNILEIAQIMQQLRVIKSDAEVDLIKRACNITEKGFRRILPFIKPGIMEYEIEAELIHEFISNRSSRFAYQPIIGSGRNSCVLHYIENNKKCNAGDILLMDFGAEYANYSSDLTRCVPVNGKFTKRQKDVYNAVLHVKNEATKLLKPGILLNEYHKVVGELMQEQLVKLGLISLNDIKNQDPKWPAYKKFFMHGTSHYIGLDTHDLGSWTKPICEKMVFTVEPGIYIPEEKLGIRLEDNVVVQSNGEPINLMKNIPIEAEEIEELMN